MDDVYTDNYPNALNAQILVARGNAFLQLGLPDEAKQEFFDAIKLDPSQTDPYLGQATIFLSQKKFSESLAQVYKAKKSGQDNPSIWYAEGAIEHAQGRVKNAMGFYQKALKLDDKHYSARLAIAGIYMAQDNLEGASAELSALFEKHPENPQLPYMLAIVAAKNGDVVKARERIVESKVLLDRLPKSACSW